MPKKVMKYEWQKKLADTMSKIEEVRYAGHCRQRQRVQESDAAA